MAAAWLSVATQKSWMRSEIPTADDAFLSTAIDAAKTTLENACQRKFDLVSGGATARSFRPYGGEVLFIHDCVTISSVISNGTTYVANTDYVAEPLNGLSNAGEAWPYYMLRRSSGCWWVGYTAATSLISVTATWGWPAIPAQIVEACKIIAKDEFNQRDTTGFGLVAISEAGGVGTRENRLVRDAVRDYAHPNSIPVA